MYLWMTGCIYEWVNVFMNEWMYLVMCKCIFKWFFLWMSKCILMNGYVY